MLPINDTIPTEGLPWMTIGLVLANLVVYVIAAAHGGSVLSGPDHDELARYGVVPDALTHPAHEPGLRPWTTALSAMFLHATIVSLLVNLLFLAIFGATVEDAVGPLRFLALYLVGGIAALALQVVAGAGGTESVTPTVGAQGAIAAALGAYIVLYHRARVLTFSLVPLFVTLFELPAVVLIVLWFAVQAAFAATRLTDPLGAGGTFAYVGYIGGGLFGALVIRAIRPRIRPVPPAHPVRPA